MQSVPNRDEQVVESIRAQLRASFGTTAASAMEFYADSHIAVANPPEYTRMLLNIFGSGTEHILVAIIAGLAKQFGVKATESTTLEDVIHSLKPKPPRPPA